MNKALLLSRSFWSNHWQHFYTKWANQSIRLQVHENYYHLSSPPESSLLENELGDELMLPNQQPDSSNNSPISSSHGHMTRFNTSNISNSNIITNQPFLDFLVSEFDQEQGLLTTQHVRFTKSYLCMTLGLQPRDLRRMDGTLKAGSSSLPIVLVRPGALLISINDQLRAIVKWDGLMMLETNSMLIKGSISSSHQPLRQAFMQELQGRLRQGVSNNTPFEFHVLESMLQVTLATMQADLDNYLAPYVEDTLASIQSRVHWDQLHALLECKKRTRLFMSKCQGIRDCLAELLESDSDMASMYLTAKSKEESEYANQTHSFATIDTSKHEEVELMLESYLKQAEDLVCRAELLSSSIDSTEDIVNLGLVGQRNDLLLLEIKLSIATFAASMGSLGASMFGMNLINGLEHGSPLIFWTMCGIFMVGAVVSSAAWWRKTISVLRRARMNKPRKKEK